MKETLSYRPPPRSALSVPFFNLIFRVNTGFASFESIIDTRYFRLRRPGGFLFPREITSKSGRDTHYHVYIEKYRGNHFARMILRLADLFPLLMVARQTQREKGFDLGHFSPSISTRDIRARATPVRRWKLSPIGQERIRREGDARMKSRSVTAAVESGSKVSGELSFEERETKWQAKEDNNVGSLRHRVINKSGTPLREQFNLRPRRDASRAPFHFSPLYSHRHRRVMLSRA